MQTDKPFTPPTSPAFPDETPVAPTPVAPAQPTATPPVSTTTSTVTTPSEKKPNGAMWALLAIVAILILVGGAIGYMVITKNASTNKPATVIPQQSSVAKPTASPVTQSNVDQTLSSTDASVGASIDQANTDLNQVSSVNTSQDSSTGL